MEQIAKETYEGKLKRGELSTEHILKTYAELEDAAKQGYGKNWLKINGDTGMTSQESVQLQKNLWKFSAAKDFTMLEKINQLMVKNGKAISWEDFKKEVMKLNVTFNKNYMQAEWQTAKQAAKMAANWESYTANAERYPNLEYRTQNDGRVRDSHYSMHGVVAPIHSDFWKSNYPPNGWRCRCFVVQTAAEPTKKEKIPVLTEKEHPLEFRGNVGISGEIFKETDANKGKPHPYFALATSGEYKKAFEYSKLATPLNKVYEAENGATVKVSPFADERELEDNLKDAILLANFEKMEIELPAHLNGRIVKNIPNPEYIINGKKADRKTPESSNYKKRLSSANSQGCEIVVMNLSVNNDSLETAAEKINQILKFDWVHPNIKEVYIISKDNEIKHYKREKAE